MSDRAHLTQNNLKKVGLLLAVWSIVGNLSAQVKPLKYGDFESWTTREVKESAIIGGKTKTIYVWGPKEKYSDDQLAPYPYAQKTIWSSSDIYAKVMGVTKASYSAEPEKRDNGYCVRLDTKLERVQALRFINISVMVSGSLFTGETYEPIKSADDPYSNLSFGVPFTQKPKALVVDYKCKISPKNYVMKCSGFSSERIEGKQDKAEIWLYLQKRWEDEKGNIHALRVGTMRKQFEKDELTWNNQVHFDIHYGDISKSDYYKDYMCLNGPYRAKNSKGKIVPIQEEGWASEEDQPTHMILMFTAGNHGAFIGTEGNTLWVDNVGFEY